MKRLNARAFRLATLGVIMATTGYQGHAVLIYGGATAANALPPVDDPGWANVGRIVGGYGGVYLGAFDTGCWVLTAQHVPLTPGAFLLGAQTYSIVAGSAVQVAGADLKLFRLGQDPGLPTLTLPSSEPTLGSAVLMIGYGYTSSAALTFSGFIDKHGSSNPSDWEWTSSGPGDPATGYLWTSAGIKRWGANTLSGFDAGNDGYGYTEFIVTQLAATVGSAQLANADSGGAAFVNGGSGWTLGGINVAIDWIQNQPPPGTPPPSGVEGDRSYMADLAFYRSDIDSLIATAPEPPASAAALAALCLAGAAARRQRKS
jgi:MYXO-CTERM domain-containing protein